MIHCQTRRVALHEVDPLQVVWHGHYLRYLEEARTEMARPFELTPEILLAEGWLPVVVDYHVECLQAASGDALLSIETIIEVPESAMLVFHSRIRGPDGMLLVRAKIRFAIRDRERGLLYRWPDALEARIQRLVEAHGEAGDAWK